MSLFTRCFLTCVVAAYTANLFAEEDPGKTPATRNLQAELPRIAAKSPQEALATFQLQPGFRIELVAAEPLVRDPVSISFDENGRAYVTELPRYNRYDFQGNGTVKILEDTNGDGTFDTAKVFLDDVKYPTAVFAYDGGAFVADPPLVLYCKDTDGDGRADVRQTVMTGFNLDHAGEAGLNSFRWGMDNRIHLSLSLAGGQVVATVVENAEPVEVRGRGMVFDPRSKTFELTTGDGQHGMTLDDWGRKFVCSNSNPMQTLMYDGRYIARNPYLAPPPPAVTIAPDGKYTKLFRTSSIEPWRNVRTRLRSQGVVKGSDEGGKAGGFFTAATGITAYRGDAWPEDYRGNLLVGEVSNNLIYRATVEPKGVGVVGRRADADAEFLSSTDNWFRPVQLANAPDGSLYVLDMYRELIEGAAFIPPMILKHLDVNSGADRGRIYRIVPEDFKQPPLPKLGQATTAELVSLLESPNGWSRDTASRLIYERQDLSAKPLLRKLTTESKSALARAHALHSLNGLKGLTAEDVLQGLADQDPHVRIESLRLAEQFAADSPQICEALYQATSDTDRQVRYQAAFSMGACNGPRRDAVLAALILKDGDDAWFRLAVQASLGQGAAGVAAELLRNQPFRESRHGVAFLGKLAEQVGTQNRDSDVATFLTSVQSLPAEETQLAQSLIGGLLGKANAKTKQQLTGTGNGKIAGLLDNLIQQARKTAADEQANPNQRSEAIRTLGLSDFAAVAELFSELLQLRQPPKIQSAALETLVRFDDAAVAELILEAWPQLSPSVRARAIETLSARPEWITALFDAVDDDLVRPADVGAARIQLLKTHKNMAIRQRAEQLFAAQALGKRDDVVKAYQSALTLSGDIESGRQLFRKNCTSCHQLEKVGTALGADLKAIKDRGSAAILLNILDPNREVKPQFVGYVLITSDGRSITGLITNETANSVTLKRADGTGDTVLRVDIDELSSTGISFMPEGLEKQLNEQQMADLLAYLNAVE
ncbi:PVC-type heme-binding CxxCH protein [Symmachiella dynata]|mgnify:CR=1 FL=1|uniref:PVC-type heme-binding CxxCH protein n=1 Tax=Symmachiella dynata TaxID=2527995 RepID=UPI0030ECB656